MIIPGFQSKRRTDSNWLLASGYYYDPGFTLGIVFPRPDVETRTIARHRVAYPGILHAHRVYAKGGVPPFKWELLQAPTGMTIGEIMTVSGDVLIDDNHGLLSWSNPTTGNHTVEIKVTDQTGSTDTVTYTLNVATSHFIFMSPSGDNANTGAIDSPIKDSDFFHSDDYTTGSYGSTAVILRGGTTPLRGMSNSSNNFRIDGNVMPPVWIGYPGESPILDLDEGHFVVVDDDFYLGDMQVQHNSTTYGSSQKFVSCLAGPDRVTLSNNTFHNYKVGTSISQNGAILTYAAVTSQYTVYGHNDHTGTHGSDCHLYYTNNTVIEGNTWTSATCNQFEGSSQGNISLKNNCLNTSIRFNRNVDSDWTGTSTTYAGICVKGAEHCDVLYNTLYRADGNAFNGVLQSETDLDDVNDDVYMARNSVSAWFGWTGTQQTNQTFQYNAVSPNSVPTGKTGLTSSDNLDGQSGIFDANMKLDGSFRTTYLGTHGAEMAPEFR